MARARNIKPAFFQNELLGELKPIERLAFIGMWTIADFKGCIEFRPKRLKVQLLPYDECNLEEIAINLDKSGFIRIYSVGGQRYIKIVNFLKHQNPHKNEREAGSDIPDIILESSSGLAAADIQNNREQNGSAPADSLILDSLNPTKPNVRSSSARFEEFWALWPRSARKVAKAACKKKWVSKGLDAIADQIIKHLTEIKKTKQWQDGFEPAPMTYINEGRWGDEIFQGDGMSPGNSKPWFITASGLEKKGEELEMARRSGEPWQDYYRRIRETAGVTEEEYRAAEVDFGQRR